MAGREQGGSGINPLLDKTELFVEQGGLRDGWDGGFAAGYAYYAEDGDFGEGRAGDEDAIGVGIQVGRSDLNTVVEEREEIVGDHTFEGLPVQESQPEPQAVQFRTAEESAALRFEIVIEVADEIDGANAREWNLLALALLSEEVERIEFAEARGIKVAAKRLAVVELNNHLFVGAGWGAKFQGTELPPTRAQFARNEIVCYVKREIPVNLLFLMDLRPGALPR